MLHLYLIFYKTFYSFHTLEFLCSYAFRTFNFFFRDYNYININYIIIILILHIYNKQK